MKYIIKERIFSLSNRFKIETTSGGGGYEVEGRFFSLGKKLKIYDSQGGEVAYIEEKLLKFLPEYSIYQNKKKMATVKKELTIMRPRFNIKSSYGNFSIEGDIMHHDFTIFKNRRPVAWISKRWVSLSDTYSLEIVDDIDHPFILALVIILDQIFYDGRKAKNNSNPQ